MTTNECLSNTSPNYTILCTYFNDIMTLLQYISFIKTDKQSKNRISQVEPVIIIANLQLCVMGNKFYDRLILSVGSWSVASVGTPGCPCGGIMESRSSVVATLIRRHFLPPVPLSTLNPYHSSLQGSFQQFRFYVKWNDSAVIHECQDRKQEVLYIFIKTVSEELIISCWL